MNPTDAPGPTPHTPPIESPRGELRVVGIGASAGGLAALRQFFSQVPADSGLAFVVVVHLQPERESHLVDLLQPHVKLPVTQVTGTEELLPDRVYVIPPNANLDTIDSHLHLSELERERTERAPIDHFFRTLARAHGGDCIGVILTGTGSDGALGIKAIKAHQGLTVVQDPGEAEFDGMPQSAIATGLVDLVLPVARIPDALLRYVGTRPRIPLPRDDDAIPDDARQVLIKVFALVRARTGRDFTRYKRSTILRRIARRMQLNHVEELHEYLELLREAPHEARALADDVLITVTNFFRDAELYEALARDVLPGIFEGRDTDDDVRVWSVGCATGEEAYSLAILLLEEAARHDRAPGLRVFASDLHDHSLQRAREGFYPGEIEVDVSAERLQRFFQHESGGYRIRKEVRDIVVFAAHNLLGDPPFSRLDLIACRNVLIYLQRDIQREVFELFHYSLRPGGHLALGSSETIDGSELFVTRDKQHRIYLKRDVPGPEPRLPVFPLTSARAMDAGIPAMRPGNPSSYGAFHQRMVERYAPPSVLVAPDDRLAHLSEHAGRYLLHPGGELTRGVLSLVRVELRAELREALSLAREQRRPVSSRPTTVRFDDGEHPVVIHARPALDPNEQDFVLVIFDERAAAETPPGHAEIPPVERSRVDELETELALVRQRLQAIIEEYETSLEETRSSNEELQSANEELRSTMEELETSKEELQSLNEELQTVNQEHRHKVEELAQLSNDLQNLLAATDIATLFLSRQLRIMRFTPRVAGIFNVRSSDRGRPVTDLTHKLDYPELRADAEAVLEHLTPVSREVQDDQGRCYLTRVLPYRSPEDTTVGVVLTFIDITDRKDAEELLSRSEERLADELKAMQRLHDLVGRLLVCSEMRTALDEMLAAVMEITRAQKGEAQLLNAQSGALEVIAHRGLGPEFLEHFGSARIGDGTPAARALQSGGAVMVADLDQDEEFAPHRDIARRVGIRAAQALPLMSREGDLLGVVSTYHTEPNRPTERDLRMLAFYARQATEFIERVRAAEALRLKTAWLEHEDRRKELFLATLGHEIRNPLAAINSALSAIETGVYEFDDVQPLVVGHVRQLTNLVNDLLDLARVNRGRIQLRPARTDLSRVVHAAARSVESDVNGRRQHLVLPARRGVEVVGDPIRLEQVVTNLLSNATRYTPKGGHIEVTLEVRDGVAVLEVRDDGRGLEPAQLRHLFEPFFRTDPASGGLGIGLTLARNLVELHGGTIEAASDGPGEGCCFTVLLPVGDLAAAPSPRPARNERRHLDGSPRVLIVDDASDAADMLATLLRSNGAETACAYTGAEGLERARSWRPDIALVDIGLPDMTGYAVAQGLRALPGGERMLLLAVTGFGQSRVEDEAHAAGFDHRLVKPVDLDELHELLGRHLDGAQEAPG